MERGRVRARCAAGGAVLVMTGIGGCGTLAEPVPDAPRVARVSTPAEPSGSLTGSEALGVATGSPLLPVAGAAAALFVGVGGVLVLLWRDRRTGVPAPLPSPRPGRGEL
ncbi:hypothetical protein ACFVFS_30690 [Kitasatospora sp. NPDC057692]|uniref:hypothetical protein n=1 Tax=unclassified Kitasatospora TaxID=2633591 RepID=UPI0035D896BF